MKKSLSLILCLMVSLCAMSAGMKQPAKWSASASRTSATEAVLQLSARIDNAWIMYSVNVPDDGPLPISLALTPDNAYAAAGELTEVIQPKQKHDDMFDMDVKYFTHGVKLTQRIAIKDASGQALVVKGTVSCQCCSDEECVPIDYDFSVSLPAFATEVDEELQQTTATEQPADTAAAQDLAAPPSPSSSSASEDESLLGFFLIALLAGFAGALTPCVFPMMPMTISFFMRGTSRRKGLTKAAVFGLSIIFIYTAVGAIVAITKSADAALAVSTHWIPNLIFFALFVVFAASFFGAFEITLPSSLANNVDQKADKGGYFSAFFVALSLVIVSFACTGPFVGTLLVAAVMGAVLQPIVGMFGFGLGLALPFTLLALFPEAIKKLPKSGGWMNRLKVFFAFVMLLFSFKFLGVVDHDLGLHLLSRELVLSFWMVLLTLMGAYFLGKLRFAHDDNNNAPVSTSRFAISLFSFAFALYLFSGFLGNPLSSMSGLLPQTTEIEHPAAIDETQQPSGLATTSTLCDATPKYSELKLHGPANLPSYFDLQEALACAKKQGKRVLLDFKGHSCANCKKMEGDVFSSKKVQQVLAEKFVIAALYLDDKTPLPEAECYVSALDGKEKKTLGQKNLDFLMTEYHTNAMPYFATLSSDGALLSQPVGYVSQPEKFLQFLEEGSTNE
jgi:thiol:disulfide interchange protein DsbD